MKYFDMRAIAIGCLVDWGGTFLFSLGFSVLVGIKAAARGLSAEASQQALMEWSTTAGGIAFSFFFGLLFTALGGYMAARVSKMDTLLNSAFVGSMGIVAGLLFFASAPLIVSVISLVVMIPTAMLGGYLHLRKWKLF